MSDAGPGRESIAGRPRNGSRCAFWAAPARSMFCIPPAATSPNSWNGVGKRWSACRHWSFRSSAKYTNRSCENFPASVGSLRSGGELGSILLYLIDAFRCLVASGPFLGLGETRLRGIDFLLNLARIEFLDRHREF